MKTKQELLLYRDTSCIFKNGCTLGAIHFSSKKERQKFVEYFSSLFPEGTKVLTDDFYKKNNIKNKKLDF